LMTAKHEDRNVASPLPGVVEFRVAHIGLIGAVVTALITALVAGPIAGYYALSNTTKQLAGETERSRLDFQRGQRQAAYGAMVADEHLLRDSETRLLQQYKAFGVPSSSAEFEELSRAIDVNYEKMQQDVAMVALVGGPATVSLAEQIRFQHDEKYSWVLVAERYNRYKFNYQPGPLKAGLSIGEEQLPGLESRFLVSVRKELES
jgi:hypothetical protein